MKIPREIMHKKLSTLVCEIEEANRQLMQELFKPDIIDSEEERDKPAKGDWKDFWEAFDLLFISTIIARGKPLPARMNYVDGLRRKVDLLAQQGHLSFAEEYSRKLRYFAHCFFSETDLPRNYFQD